MDLRIIEKKRKVSTFFNLPVDVSGMKPAISTVVSPKIIESSTPSFPKTSLTSSLKLTDRSFL